MLREFLAPPGEVQQDQTLGGTYGFRKVGRYSDQNSCGDISERRDTGDPKVLKNSWRGLNARVRLPRSVCAVCLKSFNGIGVLRVRAPPSRL